MTEREKTFEQLRQNKSILLLEKKSQLKMADPMQTYFVKESEEKTVVVKTIKETVIPESGPFAVKVAINTTNIIDSHMDLHIPGLWKKSLKESKGLYLLQEHQVKFDHIISDDVKASAVTMSWKELGYKYEGNTQVLVFDAKIDPEDNELMTKKYKQDKVKNHSVGMRYVKLLLAMDSNSKYDEEEKAVWDKYYHEAVNKEVADNHGYFWVVTEAKVIEGSAVPIGSNRATPTIEVTESKNEPSKDTQIDNIEPLKSTLTEKQISELVERIFKHVKN